MTQQNNNISDAIVDRITRLSAALRTSGVDVSLVESIEATKSILHINIEDRVTLRRCLQAVMVKQQRDLIIFDELFDQIFMAFNLGSPTLRGEEIGLSETVEPRQDGDSHDVSATIKDRLLDAAMNGADIEKIKLLLNEAIDTFTVTDKTKMSEKYFLYRILKALDIANLLVHAMRQARINRPDASEMDLRILRGEISQRLEQYRELLAKEIRRRLHPTDQKYGAGLTAPRRIEELEFLEVGQMDLLRMRKAVQPLARKLASKIGRHRRNIRQGRLDVRRTIHKSLNVGGVPFDTTFKRRRPQRPQVVVLCDISGSVSEFADFMLMLLQALKDELAGLRTFVFVDGIAEVTHILKSADSTLDPRLLLTLPGVVIFDGHSDYQNVLSSFLATNHGALTHATTLLITGDARTNYKASGDTALAQIAKIVKRVYWLNPEPHSEWATTDSAMDKFLPHCDGAFEVRNLEQLASAISEIV